LAGSSETTSSKSPFSGFVIPTEATVLPKKPQMLLLRPSF
jgi:hypothetical protein